MKNSRYHEQIPLLSLLNSRLKIAKAFTKKFHQEVDQCLKDYECKDDSSSSLAVNKHVTDKRYSLSIPYIYSTHESILSSFFEKVPELVISSKGKYDDKKAELIQAVYKYLADKLDLEEFLHNLAWWYILVGFVSSYQDYKIEISGYETIESENGPMLDEAGKEVQAPIIEYDDPIVGVDDPKSIFFSPESEYTIDGKKVPFIIRKKVMSRDEAKSLYGIELDESAKITVEDAKVEEEYEEELNRVEIFYYYGKLPENVKSDQIKNWSFDKNYFVVFAGDKVIHVKEQDKYTTLAKWFGSPTSFFGFGIGKTLRSSQREMTMRRNQQIRYADMHAYPWLMIDQQTQIDQKSLFDYKKTKPLVYSNKPPSYLVPPPMPQTMITADEVARSDAQFISGTLDLSKGAQQTNTVNTATGQQLFSQSQEKRVSKAKKIIAKHYREVVINLFKLCRDHWNETKVISITDEEDITEQYEVSGDDLKDIDFDTDIDISLDTVTINKEAIAERSISLYDKVKDDPLVNIKAVFQKMMKDGFGVKNPEAYMLREEEIQPQLTQQQGNEEVLNNQPAEQQVIGQQLAPKTQFYG